MTSRPAAPESLIPIHGYLDGKAVVEINAIEQLERMYTIAQTEIKGHMKTEDDLKCDIGIYQASIEKFAMQHQRKVMGLEKSLREAQSRIAELEKVLVSLLAFPFEIEKLERGSKEWAAAMAEHGEVLEAAQILVGAVGSLKSRA